VEQTTSIYNHRKIHVQLSRKLMPMIFLKKILKKKLYVLFESLFIIIILKEKRYLLFANIFVALIINSFMVSFSFNCTLIELIGLIIWRRFWQRQKGFSIVHILVILPYALTGCILLPRSLYVRVLCFIHNFLRKVVSVIYMSVLCVNITKLSFVCMYIKFNFSYFKTN